MLPVAFDGTLAAIVGRKAADIACTALSIGPASDHVHVLLRLSPVVALATVIKQIKGASAYDINHGCLLPHQLIWQPGYWAESFGPGDMQPLLEYVRAQRLRHDDSHPAERWLVDDETGAVTGEP
jgi:REP element-mobilizing transposase RayT